MAKTEKWTLMFYFASDNPLAPNVVTQLKALTNAGFHEDVNVITYFDPQTEGTDTHIFDVNLVSKLIHRKKGSRDRFKFWGESDPFIRNLVFDKLWCKHHAFSGENKIREDIVEYFAKEYDGLEYNPPDPTLVRVVKPQGAAAKAADSTTDNRTEPGPKASLEAFLKFCAKSYPAEHYMLFILGHGVVVGNDMFLFDEHAAEDSLSLSNLSGLLKDFTKNIRAKSKDKMKKLDLISFHSCSLSALEVAYELRDSVTYMLASEGPAFVGSWPYREILMRLFKNKIKMDKGGKNSPDLRSSMKKIFEYVLRYSYDFQLAGYSFDLCLCDLRQVEQIVKPLKNLAEILTKNLKDTPFVKEAILLAHWDAQSYWQESYTDLRDFCRCLKQRCVDMSGTSKDAKGVLKLISDSCQPVIDILQKERNRRRSTKQNDSDGDSLIVRAAFAGPEFQYSHGLSVYFPWAEPTNIGFWPNEYKEKYAFKDTGWGEFLHAYFKATKRDAVVPEMKAAREFIPKKSKTDELRDILLEEVTRKSFNTTGPLSRLAGGKPGGESATGPKPGGEAGEGGDCDCPSIKNYPSFTRDPRDSRDEKVKTTSSDFFHFLLDK